MRRRRRREDERYSEGYREGTLHAHAMLAGWARDHGPISADELLESLARKQAAWNERDAEKYRAGLR